MKVVLVSCVSKKLDRPAPAEDLYQSTWFKLARRYAEAHSDKWFILSAKHHLLNPIVTIPPYDVSLKDFGKEARAEWGWRVARSIEHLWRPNFWRLRPDIIEIEILAGKLYRESLAPILRDRNYPITVPMEGLGIGQQQKWLKENT